jgi:hypothetical protein
MNTTATRALRIAAAVVIAAARVIYNHRQEILDTIARGLLAIEAAARWCWAHRQQARDAVVLAALATLAAGAWTRQQAGRCYRAGQAARRAVDALSNRSAVLLPQQPVAAVAPITATLQAAREALAQLVARLYPEPALA